MNILVIGVGNEFCGDDAVGVLVARHLGEQYLPGVTVIEQNGEGSELITAWEGQERVIVIDAAQSGAEPGTIHCFNAHNAPLPIEFFNFSSHAFGVAEAIKLSHILGELPDRLMVFGIEGVDFATGLGLSQPVEQAFEIVVQRLLEEIQIFPTAKSSSVE